MKFFFIVSLFFFSVKSFAQTTGYGCRVGNVIYTQYLGMGHPYSSSNPLKRFYKSDGPSLNMNFQNYKGSNSPTFYGYECGLVNEFPASSTGPAQQEAVNQNESCVIAKTLEGPVEGEDRYVQYYYNNPQYCTVAAFPAPVDNYFLYFAIPFVGFCLTHFFKRTYILNL